VVGGGRGERLRLGRNSQLFKGLGAMAGRGRPGDTYSSSMLHANPRFVIQGKKVASTGGDRDWRLKKGTGILKFPGYDRVGEAS